MPTYNYKCKDCKHTFSIEASIDEKSNLEPVCPECEGTNIIQIFKSVGVINNCSGSSCNSCGGC